MAGREKREKESKGERKKTNLGGRVEENERRMRRWQGRKRECWVKE